MKKATAIVLLVCVAVFAQQKGTFTDTRDKKVYKTAKIGKQTWMAENLNYDPGAGNSACYENKPENCAKYGRLYDWATAMTVCPKGWHLPSSKEWQTLSKLVGDWEYEDGGETVGSKKLKAKTEWEEPLNDGTDNYGFSALPGGLSDGRNFSGAGRSSYWWTASETSYGPPEFGNAGAAFISMDYFDVDAGRDNINKSFLYSVRCVKD